MKMQQLKKIENALVDREYFADIVAVTLLILILAYFNFA